MIKTRGGTVTQCDEGHTARDRSLCRFRLNDSCSLYADSGPGYMMLAVVCVVIALFTYFVLVH